MTISPENGELEFFGSQIHDAVASIAGELQILSVGRGDWVMLLGNSTPEEIEESRRVITKMLGEGYSIFVETDKGLSRVKRYNDKRNTYVIGGEPIVGAKAPDVEVPVAASKARAVGRPSGG